MKKSILIRMDMEQYNIWKKEAELRHFTLTGFISNTVWKEIDNKVSKSRSTKVVKVAPPPKPKMVEIDPYGTLAGKLGVFGQTTIDENIIRKFKAEDATRPVVAIPEKAAPIVSGLQDDDGYIPPEEVVANFNDTDNIMMGLIK